MTFNLDVLGARVLEGGRLSAAEALWLYREAPTMWLGRMADALRRRKHPDGVVTYIIDRNVNYTNVCVARCNFCAFYRTVGHAEGYVLGFDEIFRKIDETIALGGDQLLLQGGHNPDLPLAWYEDLFRGVKARYPGLQAARALAARGPAHRADLEAAGARGDRAAGGRRARQHPGGGAEILVDRVRKLLNCYTQGHRRRVARRDARGASRPACARRRR